MDTKLATIGVEKRTYADFTAAVLAKHGKLRGAVQEEATAALRAHIDTMRPE